jgi:hypothetical protein
MFSREPQASAEQPRARLRLAAKQFATFYRSSADDIRSAKKGVLARFFAKRHSCLAANS